MKPACTVSVKMQPMIDDSISTDYLKLEPSWRVLSLLLAAVVVVVVVVAQRAGY